MYNLSEVVDVGAFFLEDEGWGVVGIARIVESKGGLFAVLLVDLNACGQQGGRGESENELGYASRLVVGCEGDLRLVAHGLLGILADWQ